ncbi:MAG: hypothetical protein ACRBM6_10040 [Geminicoccales bacterium]
MTSIRGRPAVVFTFVSSFQCLKGGIRGISDFLKIGTLLEQLAFFSSELHAVHSTACTPELRLFKLLINFGELLINTRNLITHRLIELPLIGLHPGLHIGFAARASATIETGL